MKLSGRGGRPSEAGAGGGMGRSAIAGAFAVTLERCVFFFSEYSSYSLAVQFDSSFGLT